MIETINTKPAEDSRIYPEPQLSRPKLRIGLMLDSLSLPAWQAKVIADIAKAPYLELSLVVLNTRQPQKRSFLSKLKALWPIFLFVLYEKLDRKFHRREDDAFQPMDVTSSLENVPLLKVEAIQKKFVDRFHESDLEKIKATQLDVLIRFGFRIIKGEILSAARFGVWSYHHGDNREYRGTPPLFWEMYERNPVSGTVLQILSDQLDGGRVIYRSTSSTYFTSLYCNRNPVYWKTAEFIPRRLRDLYSFGWEFIENLPTFHENIRYERQIYRTPRNREMLVFLCRLAGRLGGALKRYLRVEQWVLGVEKLGDSNPSAPANFLVIRPPGDHFYADPFLLSHEGREFLFFEDYPYRTGKGVISCVELADGKPSSPRVVLERPYHLSYPFLFCWGDDVFMLPETGANRTVELYRAVDFPERWEIDRVLLSGIEAANSTLIEHKRKFCLFACVTVHRPGTSPELLTFFADSPFGPWHPHPMNPIVSDVRNARPAGKVFRHEGELVRPAQDCSVRYGHAIRFNTINVLSETEYRESPRGAIGPEWMPDSLATHTFSQDEAFRVLDALCSVRKPLWRPLAGSAASRGIRTESITGQVRVTLSPGSDTVT
jgi:hypothetical protein